ncbi:MAG: efflux RND transporter permease subunit, partial [Deltaproteobacteria bacterium]|nr:efflux RND transporter permease subunit [Deltaproteobacteria bacterium]
MKIAEISIRRPVFTTMMACSLIVLGGLGLSRLGTELFPDVNFPFVTVTTVYPGAGPEDIEQQVTRPIEDAVAGIDGVNELRSYSRENVSFVIIQFKLSADTETVTQEVRDQVAALRRSLPETVEDPRVARLDIRAQSVLVYTAIGRVPVEQVRQVIDDRVRPVLEQVDGVALVRIEGGRERELRVLLQQEKLDSLNLPVAAVFEALRRENINIPSGHLRRGPLEIGVRTDAQVRSAGELERLVVSRTPGGAPVLLADVAEVVDGYKEQRLLVRTNGREAVAVEVVKRAGANTMALAREVKAAMARLVPTLPDGIEATLLVDGSQMIAENAEEVEWAIVFGGAMAVLVILFFLLDVRGTLISSLALPTSVIGTFAVMYALGYSLNMMTLLGLSLAIGLLIDDSVVVREAITRRLEAGEPPFSAARQGTAEVGLAVLATSFTICAVFVPVAFMQGIVGQFFEQFGLTVVAAVLLSCFVALTLDPMLSARFSVTRRPGQRQHVILRGLEAGFAALEQGYRWLLTLVLRWKLATLGLAVLACAGSVWLAVQLGFEFITPEDRAQFIVNLEFPPGTSLEEASARSMKAERALLGHPDVVAVNATVGRDDQVRRVRYRVKTMPKQQRHRSMAQIKDDIRPALTALPQVTYAISDLPIIEGTGDMPPIVMQISGP